MRTLIVYESQSGSTKKYAEDIAKAVSADLLPLKKFKAKIVPDYDCIVFGGWVRGAQIMGLNDFLAKYDAMEGKDVLVFSAGLSPASEEGRKQLISSNILDLYHVRYYQLQGSFDYAKLPLKSRLMFDFSIRRLQSDPETDPLTIQQLVTVKNTPISFYDQAKIDRIIAVINKLSLERATK